MLIGRVSRGEENRLFLMGLKKGNAEAQDLHLVGLVRAL